MILRSTPQSCLRHPARFSTVQSLPNWPAPAPQPRRAFSLFPAAMSPPPPDPVPATPSVPVKPVLTDLFAPTSLPDPTFFEPLSAVFLALPPTLSLSYAAFVPLFTLFYRSATTLPITLWQRRRTKRFAEVVMPLVRRKQAEIALQTRDECRRAGKTYEEYQKVFKKKAKEAAYALARKHSCSPRLTLILPPLFHIPIFITATLVLRDACARATSLLSVTTESLPSLLTASPSSQLTTTALSHLQDLAATSFLWCPSLALPDPTMFLPLFVGLASLLNVEVTARTRRATTSAAQALDRPAAPEQLASSQQQGGGVISAAEKRRFLARRAREGAPVNVRGLATSANPTGAGSGSVTADVGAGIKDDRQQRRVTNMLRGAAVAFIPLAGMAPSAVCIYWVTSNLFTLVQNLTLWWIDRSRQQQKRMERILVGKAVRR